MRKIPIYVRSRYVEVAAAIAKEEELSVARVFERSLALYQQFKAGKLAVVDRPQVVEILSVDEFEYWGSSEPKLSGFKEVSYEEHAEEFLVK